MPRDTEPREWPREERRAPTILCASYGGGHVNACLPVAQAMMARGWNVQFLALTTAFGAVSKTDVPVWQARDLIGADEHEITAHGERLAGNATEGGPVSREETIAYHALGYHDLIAAHGLAEAERIYADKGRAAFEHGELARRMLDRVQPDLVLTTNSPRAEKALIDHAQARGIPAVVLNDTLASASNDWLHNPAYADRILVVADAVRDVLTASGHAPQKIIVTGNPALEPMADLREKRRDRPVRQSHKRRKVVLYASQPLGQSRGQSLNGDDAAHKTALIAQLQKIAAARDDLEVRVRLHPNELAGESGGPDWLAPPLTRNPGASLPDDLYDADVLITHGSTVGIEAALAGIPVVLQRGPDIAENCRFEEYGIATSNGDVTDLEAAIDRALSPGVASSHAAPFTMPPNALGNVASVLEEMMDAR